MDDLIKRQDAIDIVTFECGEWQGIANRINEQIQRLPSAEPVIRCKDCKYFEQYTDDGTFESVLKMHQWDGECSEWVGHTYMGWFCSRWKSNKRDQRNDGQNEA